MPWRCMGEWKYRSIIFYHGIKWRRVVGFTPLPLYPLLPGKCSRYPLVRHLRGPQTWSGLCGVQKYLCPYRGARCSSWLRHYDTSRKVAGSILNEVIGFFIWPNPSSCTMIVESTQLLTEISTRNFPGNKNSQLRRLLWVDFLENVEASNSHNPMGLHGLLQG
jgi:hypothetical protein